MKKTHIILITVLIFAVLIVLASLIGRSQLVLNENSLKDPVNDPIDVASTLADDWLRNLNATNTIPLPDFLTTRTDITEALRDTLTKQSQVESDKDIILCQPNIPARVGVKPIYVTDAEAQVSIIPRGGEKTPVQSIVTLTLSDDTWIISDITCSAGEAGGPVGEYSFEQIGRLVKESVPAPYDKNTWHLIFTRTDDTVQVVQLLFDETSECTTDAGVGVCTPDTFSEGSAAYVQADMTEAGALVKKLDVQ